MLKSDPVLLTIGAVPLLLLIAPAFYYSMDTPIGLFERSPGRLHIYDSVGNFFRTIEAQLVETEIRFRPFFVFWIGLHWKLFGEVAWPFQLSRWLVHFGAFALFAAAFTRVVRSSGRTPRTSSALLLTMPLALLAYPWLTYPNVCLVRIECVETFTVFFLGLCNLATALMLTTPQRRPRVGHHALFFVGFLGLVSSKEPNIAAATWLLVCYWAWVVGGQSQRGRYMAVAATMTLILGFTIYKINESLQHASAAGTYFARSAQSTADRFADNAAEILQGLFQWQTSTTITWSFTCLLSTLIMVLVTRLVKRRFDGELVFVVLLLGQFMAMFLVLSYQHIMALRYWSVLVPFLAMLLAFAARFMLDLASRWKLLANSVAIALAAFVVLFVSANYYNFLYQIIGHHSARNLDELVIQKVADLLNAGQYIMVHEVREQSMVLNSHWNFQKHWPDSPWGKESVHDLPPKDPAQPYYILDVYGNARLRPLRANALWEPRSEYGVLDLPRKVSAFVQRRETPYIRVDKGQIELGIYRMAMYFLPHSMDEHVEDLIAQTGEPIRRAFFDVHLQDHELVYVRRVCGDEDLADRFFLHLVAGGVHFLPPHRMQYGFDNLDFYFYEYGMKSGGVCLVRRALPQYPITQVSTGQYDSAGRKWEVTFHVPARPQAEGRGLPGAG